MDIVSQLTSELNLSGGQVVNTLSLLNEGATIPFIARYRKERTGNLDEVQIRSIDKKHRYYQELEERRETILESIGSQGKLTPELETKIRDTLNKTELEDLYLPYRPKKATRASESPRGGVGAVGSMVVYPSGKNSRNRSQGRRFYQLRQRF